MIFYLIDILKLELSLLATLLSLLLHPLPAAHITCDLFYIGNPIWYQRARCGAIFSVLITPSIIGIYAQCKHRSSQGAKHILACGALLLYGQYIPPRGCDDVLKDKLTA